MSWLLDRHYFTENQNKKFSFCYHQMSVGTLLVCLWGTLLVCLWERFLLSVGTLFVCLWGTLLVCLWGRKYGAVFTTIYFICT